MTQESQPSRRRTLLLSGLLLTTIAAGWMLKAGDASGTPGTHPAWRHASGSGPVTLSARADRTAVLTGDNGEVRVELVLAAEERNANRLTTSMPTDLLVVLDRSGSMQGEKLAHGLAAVRELIAQLSAIWLSRT